MCNYITALAIMVLGVFYPQERKLERMEELADPSRAAFHRQPGFGGLIGESASMHRLYELIKKRLAWAPPPFCPVGVKLELEKN